MEVKCWDWIAGRPPCQAACPAGTDVPGYTIAVAQGRYQDAYQVLKSTLPLPAICAYVCHHPCEAKCVRGKLDEPIAIRAIKRFVTDYAASSPQKKSGPSRKADARRQKVAIVGSGPAGLTAAQNLAIKGYDVTVFEALPVAGGMLAVGIPHFVMPKEVLKSEIDAIESVGVKIKTGARIGKDIGLDDLRQQYKAIFLAVGKQDSSKLNLTNGDAAGVVYALPFLRDANLGNPAKLSGRVAVIGGGNVAIDSARTAVRLGATEVSCVYRRTREEMPAFEWEVARAVEEGVKLSFGLAPSRISVQSGRVSAIEFDRVQSARGSQPGRKAALVSEGSKVTLEASTIIVAIGQSADMSFARGVKGLDAGGTGSLVADPNTLATGIPGVLAGGDILAAEGTAVDAIAAGQKAAESIDRYLRGSQNGLGKLPPVIEVANEKLPKFVQPRKRQRMPLAEVSKRKKSFASVELGMPEKVAVEEASRCLDCPMCGNCMFDRNQMCHKTASRLL